MVIALLAYRKYFVVCCLLVVLGFCVVTQVYAQRYKQSHYSVDDVLIADIVKCVLHDQQGFVWIGSDEGIIRFDGKNTLILSDALPSRYVKAIQQLSDGRVLAVTDLGIVQLKNFPDTVEVVTMVSGELVTGKATDSTIEYPKTTFEDAQKRLWIAEYNAISRVDGTKLKRYSFERSFWSDQFHRSFNLLQSHDGTLWATAYPQGLFFYNISKDAFEEVKLQTNIKNISSFVVYKPDTFLLGASDGLWLVAINADKKVTQQTLLWKSSEISKISILPNGEILCATWSESLWQLQYHDKKIQQTTELAKGGINNLHVEPSGNIWVACNDGLILLQRTRFEYVELAAPADLANRPRFVYCIAQGKNNQILVNTQAGMFAIEKQHGAYTNSFALRWNTGKYIARVAMAANNLIMGDSEGRLYMQTSDEKIIELQKPSNEGRYNNAFAIDTAQTVWVWQDGARGLFRVMPEGKIMQYVQEKGLPEWVRFVKTGIDRRIYVGGHEKNAYLYVYDAANDYFKNISLPLPDSLQAFSVYDLEFTNDSTGWVASNQGLYRYERKTVQKFQFPPYTDEAIKAITTDKEGNLWIANSFGVFRIAPDKSWIIFNKTSGLPANTSNYNRIFVAPDSSIWIGTAKGLGYSVKNYTYQKPYKPLIVNITIDGTRIAFYKQQQLQFKHNAYVKITVGAMQYPADKVVFEHRITPYHASWQATSSSGELILPALTSGEYQLMIRAVAQGSGDNWSEAALFSFTVEKAWYQTIWAIVGAVLLLFIVIVAIVKIYTASLKKDKERLERVVTQRTLEIVEKNKILNQQTDEIIEQARDLRNAYDEITQHNNAILQQKAQIESANRQMVESIQYAKRIQSAALPDVTILNGLVDDYFVLFEPRDIVSGDFYWIKTIDKQIIIAAADCTGHGVPGAFMSMLGVAFLNELVHQENIKKPAQALEYLRRQIKESLRQTGSVHEPQDGMDIAFCVIQTDTHVLEYAGAHSPIYIFQQQTLVEIKADPMPIGFYWRENTFTNHEIQLHHGDTLYLFSDGYFSQIGGDKGHERYRTQRFKQLLTDIVVQPMLQQQAALMQTLKEWQGNYQRMDDILVIGIKI